MATGPDRPLAPYAPLGNVLTVIRRLRERGVPVPVTKDALTVLGIPEGNAPRTLQALKLLGLVGEDGALSPASERIRRASTEEYPDVLAEVIRDAYSPVFAVVDPATDTEVRVSDAFRQFDPATQRGRMVTLFLGLCAEAGIASPRPDKAPRTPRTNRSSGPRRSRSIAAPAASPIATAQIQSSGHAGDGSLLFGVTVEDIGALPADEFDAVWAALGKIAKARANSLRDTQRLAEAIEASRLPADEEAE